MFAAIAGLVLALAPAAQAVNIETVPVGNPGNAADTAPAGYGAVAYEYNIGKYEVTNTQYAAFLTAVDPGGADPLGLHNASQDITYAGGSYTADAGFEQKPVHRMSFWSTCRFANWLHNGQGAGNTEDGAYTLTAAAMAANTVTRNAGWKWAVPSEDEWYKAAYYDPSGPVYYDYANGSNTPPTATTVALQLAVPPGSANYAGAVGATTDVGAYSGWPTDSPYETFDQAGNLYEWNETIIFVGSRVLRGGSFNFVLLNHLSSSDRYSNFPTTELDFFGFRVVQIPEPATMALLAFGGLGLVLRRKSKIRRGGRK